MQSVINFIHQYAGGFFTVFIALAVLRCVLCLIELRHTARLRDKKGKYHSVRGQYSEIGGWIFSLPGLIWGVAAAPKLWYGALLLAAVGFWLGYRLGRRKGRALDAMYREIALELQQEEAAEAAREAAAHTLEGGGEPLPEHDVTAEAEEPADTADTHETTHEGDTENG